MLTFGNALQSKLQLLARKSKKQVEADRRVKRELDKWLSSADTKTAPGRYADPAKLFPSGHTRKV